MILHRGGITELDRSGSRAIVEVDGAGECSACAVARFCSAGKASVSSANRIRLSVPVGDVDMYKVGDRVEIAGTERLQRKAMTLVTILPCLILVAVMVTVYLLTMSQSAAALSGIAAMLLFFLILYLLRNNIRHEFLFKIVKRL